MHRDTSQAAWFRKHFDELVLYYSMSHKPFQNRQLTAANRPVNWEFNRSGYRGSIAMYFLISNWLNIFVILKNYRISIKIVCLSIFEGVLKPLVQGTLPNFT